MNYVYQFPVVKGVQANQEYYIAMVPLKMLIRLFPEDEEYVLPEFRAQRRLNASRIPVMKNYILKNRNNYVFSALAASIDGELKYKPNKDSWVNICSIFRRIIIHLFVIKNYIIINE